MAKKPSLEEIVHAVDYNRFRHTRDVLSRARMDQIHKNETADHFKDQDLAELVGCLESHGFRHVSNKISRGFFAIVLEANHNQMIRIVDKEAEYSRHKEPDVLQPVQVIDELPRYRIEILPKVHTLSEILAGRVKKDPQRPIDNASKQLADYYGLSKDPEQAKNEIESYVLRLISDNMKNGQFFYDVALSNICLVKDEQGKNVPLVLDPCAKISAKQMQALFDKPHERGQKAENDELDQFADTLSVYPVFNQFQEFMVEQMITTGCMDARVILKHYLKNISEHPLQDEMPYEKVQEAHLKRLGLKAGESVGVISGERLQEGADIAGSSLFQKMVGEDGLYQEEIGAIVKKSPA
jgi:hypothetical protein